MLTRSEVIVLTNAPTNKHTHKPAHRQIPLKTSNVLRYATTLGKKQCSLSKLFIGIEFILHSCTCLALSLFSVMTSAYVRRSDVTSGVFPPAATRQMSSRPQRGRNKHLQFSQLIQDSQKQTSYQVGARLHDCCAVSMTRYFSTPNLTYQYKMHRTCAKETTQTRTNI